MDIHELMQGYRTAWERRDPSMFAALFVPDGRCHNTEARIGWHSMPEPPRIDGWLCPMESA